MAFSSSSSSSSWDTDFYEGDSSNSSTRTPDWAIHSDASNMSTEEDPTTDSDATERMSPARSVILFDHSDDQATTTSISEFSDRPVISSDDSSDVDDSDQQAAVPDHDRQTVTLALNTGAVIQRGATAGVEDNAQTVPANEPAVIVDPVVVNVSENSTDSSDSQSVLPVIEEPQLPPEPVPQPKLEPTPKKDPSKPSQRGKRKKESSPWSSDDEGQNCSICFEPWTNSGDHRISSLRCGHLFGYNCIHKWLRGANGRCPQCNTKSKRSDIRKLYAKSLKAVDTAERDRALADLEKEREARRLLEVEMAQTRLQYQMTQRQVASLEARLKHQSNQRNSPRKKNESGAGRKGARPPEHGLTFDRTIEVCKDSGARVLASCDFMSILAASKTIQHNPFSGFGVKKINTADFSRSDNIFLHKKPIRDMAFNAVKHDGLLLTASMDKTVKITSMLTNAVVQTYVAEVPAWSCVWNKDNPVQFFVGLLNGVGLLYDTRQTQTFVQQVVVEGSRSPAVSMQYVKMQPFSSFSQGGLLLTQLDRCTFFELRESEYRPHFLPIEGPFTSVSLEEQSRHILVSCRPSSKHPNVRHMLCQLTSRDSACSCDIVQTFEGGGSQALLSRSMLVPHPNRNALLACAGDETKEALVLWDVDSTASLPPVKVSSPVLDICPLRLGRTNCLGVLGSKNLQLYRFTGSGTE